MMRRIRVLIQAGHSAAFEPHQQGGGGAPGEAAWTGDLATRLSARLATRGVDVVLVGCWNVDNSNAPAAVTEQDYDLFLSLHYDADIYPVRTGCFADRAANDPVGPSADRFIALWEPLYTKATGIPLHNERRNSNTWNYYVFRATTAKTPGVILEHGVGQGLDRAALFDRIDAVADADAAAVLAYLGIENGGAPPMTDEERRILAALAERGLATEQAIRDLYTYGDQTEKDVAALRQEVAYLKDALAQLPPAPPPVAVEGASLAVRVQLSDGRTVEVPLGKGVPG